MIKKGEKFKITGISKKDSYWRHRKEYGLYDKIYTADENLDRWEKSLTFWGAATATDGTSWYFHSIQLKRVKD